MYEAEESHINKLLQEAEDEETNVRNVGIFTEDLTQFTNVEIGLNCANCASMGKQLHSALLELKSAEAIISLLREDVKNTTLGSSADPQYLAPSCETSECETSEYEQTSEKWTSVVCKNSKIKVTCDRKMVNIQQHLVSTNRFAPLSTLTENQEDMMEQASKCKRPQSINPTMESTLQHSTGWKIPTIVNGRIINNFNNNKKPIRKINNQLRTPSQRSAKRIHKVEIIGDSHLKGSAVKINQYRNTKFKVCGLTKPGASTNQLVCSQENDLKCLGKSDVIVINGGDNDIDKFNIKDNGILISMVHFIQKYSNCVVKG